MKDPDYRPRFQSSTRHYHRYREEKRDDWSQWIEGSDKGTLARISRRRRFLRWTIVFLVAAGVASAIWLLLF